MTVKRWIKLIGVLSLAIVFALSLTPTAGAASSYDPIPGTQTSFVKTLVMSSSVDIPAAVIRFTVEAGEPVEAAAEDGGMAVRSGPVVIDNDEVVAPSIAELVFTVGEAAGHDGLSVQDNTPEEGLKTASKTVTVDFSGVSFSAPGVYRYVITEEAAESQGIVNDATEKRTVDVYVDDDGDGKLVIAGYTMYLGEVSEAPDLEGTPAGEKSSGYTNEYVTHDLTIGLVVTGNQASRYQYFAVTVQLANAPAGTTFPVDMSDAETSIPLDSEITPVQTRAVRSGPQLTALSARAALLGSDDAIHQPDSLTADKNGKITQIYYLRHDQSLRILGLPPGVTYEASEDPLDYTMTLGAKGDFVRGLKELSATPKGTMTDRDEDLGFTNTRNGAIPTGLTLTEISGLLLVAMSAPPLLLLVRKRRDQE